jgi:transcriptional regulator with XRE-family HTH domain
MPHTNSVIVTPESGGLRLAREGAGLSQRRLAQAAGVSRGTVRAYEAKADPELTPTFVRIASAIDAARYGNGGDPSLALAGRIDELEYRFGELLGILASLARAQAGLIEGGAR